MILPSDPVERAKILEIQTAQKRACQEWCAKQNGPLVVEVDGATYFFQSQNAATSFAFQLSRLSRPIKRERDEDMDFLSGTEIRQKARETLDRLGIESAFNLQAAINAAIQKARDIPDILKHGG